MRQQENKKENFRENPTKLTWIPKVYNYAERTGKPFWVVHEDMERDIFMSATEAQAYGIVDFVAVQGK